MNIFKNIILLLFIGASSLIAGLLKPDNGQYISYWI